jgi:AraC-like DNA-binding protein
VLLARPPRIHALVPFVESIWVYRGGHANGHERLLPNGRMQLLVSAFENEPLEHATQRFATLDASIQGPRVQPVIIDTAGQRAICGVSFEIGGAYPFFRARAADMTDQTVDLASLWGRNGAVLRERVLEAGDDHARLEVLESVLVEQVCRGFTRDAGFDLAYAMLARGVPVAQVEGRLGLSPARFIERFRERTGLTPKRFARLERFQRLLHAVDDGRSWSELALAYGYADQAHMIRDFKLFSETVPSGYRARSPEQRNHVPLSFP